MYKINVYLTIEYQHSAFFGWEFKVHYEKKYFDGLKDIMLAP